MLVAGGKDAAGQPVKEKPLHVVHITVEMAPVAKVGAQTQIYKTKKCRKNYQDILL